MSGLPWQQAGGGGGSSAASPPRSPLLVPGTTLLPTLAAATVAASSSPSPARRAIVVSSSRRAGNGSGGATAGAAALASADSGADRYFDALAGSRPVSDDEDAACAAHTYADDDDDLNDGGGGGGDDEEDYTPSSSGYTDDLIDEILENYRFTFQPEVRVKLRRRLAAAEGGVALCACYSKPWQKEPRWRFTVKPGKHGWGRGLALSASDEREDEDEEADEEEAATGGAARRGSSSGGGGGRRANAATPAPKTGAASALGALQRLAGAHVRKLLVVPSLSSAMLFTSKVPVLGVLRLQLAAGYNWRRRAPMLEYRLTTKWGGDAGGRLVRRKEEYQLSPACLLRAKWHLDAHFPDMEGHLGAAGEGVEGGGGGGGGGGGSGGGGAPAAAIDVDYGGMHFEVSQLDVVLDF